jgi:alpha-beta hydrolase superfamily lysophospholipase
MHVIFDDPQFDFQTLRLLGSAATGDAEVGEVLSTAARITPGDFASWTAQWLATARRVHGVADECKERGHLVSAREAYLRAANYYRAAEFYLHGDPADRGIRHLSREARWCFLTALALSPGDVTALVIPYENTALPGYFYPAAGAARPVATLIAHSGFDGTQEELRATALAANARGMHCVTFEGPGQGAVIREEGLPFRPDWEAVVAPVLDHVLTLPEVDPDRIALLGLSFGGYLAPRAAAFEHRLAACIANGGVFDFMANNLPPGMTRQAAATWVREQPQAAEQVMRDLMSASTDTRWAVQNGMFTFGSDSPGAWFRAALDYTLDGVAQRIQCPTLVIDTEGERAFQGQAKALYDALTCEKSFMLFTAAEGAEDHCQVGSPLLSAQRVFDWLEETLSRVSAASSAGTRQ